MQVILQARRAMGHAGFVRDSNGGVTAQRLVERDEHRKIQVPSLRGKQSVPKSPDCSRSMR